MPAAQIVRPLQVYTAGAGGRTATVYVGDSTTLAPLFYDRDGIIPAPNPGQLARLDGEPGNYGRWVQPVYTSARSYRVKIDGVLQTGIYEGPDQPLDGVDISRALVAPFPGQAGEVRVDAAFALTVSIALLGTLQLSAADANTTLIQAGLAICQARGGGEALLPPGSFDFGSLVIPPRTRLRGNGDGVTLIRSRVADGSIKPGGPGAGLADLTLDGEIQADDSIGVDFDLYPDFGLDRVTIRRFEKPMRLRGGGLHRWTKLVVEGNSKPAELWSDDQDKLVPGDTKLEGIEWLGGAIRQNIGDGVHIKDRGKGARRFLLKGLDVRENLGAAVRVTGGHQVEIEDSGFARNARHILVEDQMEVQPSLVSKFVTVRASTFVDGTTTYGGNTENLLFVGCRFERQAWEAAGPRYPVMLERCEEVDIPVIIGDMTRIRRIGSPTDGRSRVRTTTAVPKTVFSSYLAPGQTGMMVAWVTARCVTDFDKGANYELINGIYRNPAILNYINLVADFHTDSVVTGSVSGATARIVQVNDDGPTFGTLGVVDIKGDFIDNEQLADDQGGVGQLSGPLEFDDVFVVGSATPRYMNENPSGLAAQIQPEVSNIVVKVTGTDTDTFDWLCEAKIVVTD